jgi:hypothetical protein
MNWKGSVRKWPFLTRGVPEFEWPRRATAILRRGSLWPGWTRPQKLLNTNVEHYRYISLRSDCLCGLLFGVSGCRPTAPGFDSRRCQIFLAAVGLERGPLSPCEDK